MAQSILNMKKRCIHFFNSQIMPLYRSIIFTLTKYQRFPNKILSQAAYVNTLHSFLTLFCCGVHTIIEVSKPPCRHFLFLFLPATLPVAPKRHNGWLWWALSPIKGAIVARGALSNHTMKNRNISPTMPPIRCVASMVWSWFPRLKIVIPLFIWRKSVRNAHWYHHGLRKHGFSRNNRSMVSKWRHR